jgi:hypothetical protein
MSEAALTAKAHMALLHEMADHGHRPDAVMYFSMISGLTQAGSAWSYGSTEFYQPQSNWDALYNFEQ